MDDVSRLWKNIKYEITKSYVVKVPLPTQAKVPWLTPSR